MENGKEELIKTDATAKNGQTKCPKCGATDISLNSKTGQLQCNFCRHQFEPEKFDVMENNIENLKGEIVGTGATDIVTNAENMITLKCTSCGAEVVIDTADKTQARCHWCRNTLSINEQVPNGAVPDTVLPFCITKKDAQQSIEEFVGKRKFYAHPQFKAEFKAENIMGVYLPYMVVDVNTHINLQGQGEVETDHWTEKHGDSSRTYYDANLFNVSREFDLTIEGLTVESSKDKLDLINDNKTNNIINAIMPFDIENCVKWDSNYIRGYTSEKRDINIDNLKPLVNMQCQDVARYAANKTITKYDRGVRWDSENMDIKGRQWKAAYLPVWLYSYLEKNDGQNILHYVAVNARTKETVGSVPINRKKLLLMSFIVEIFGFLAAILSFYKIFDEDSLFPWLFLASGFVYYFIIYNRYRNKGARHYHERETKNKMQNLKSTDNYVKKLSRLENPRMSGSNNNRISGTIQNSQFITNIIEDFNTKMK